MMKPKSTHGERELWISRGVGPIGNMRNLRVYTRDNKQERGKNREKEERERSASTPNVICPSSRPHRAWLDIIFMRYQYF